MNSAFLPPPPRPLTFSLLAALALVAAACSPVDIDEGLVGLTDRCVNAESCAPGFTCEAQHCVRKAGEACLESFENALCEKSQGVCAGVRRACTGGVVEASCSEASYGPQYQALESLCDGLDNDCDGAVDTAVDALPLAGVNLAPGNLLAARLAPFGDGLIAVSINAVNQGTPQQPSYQSTLRFQPLSHSRTPLPGVEAQVLHQATGALSDLQLLPFQGGVFVLWQGLREVQLGNGQSYYAPVTQIARVDVGAGTGQPTVGLAPRDLPNPYNAYYVRAAVSADSQRLLVIWLLGSVRGQLFSRALEPVSAEVTLSGPHPQDPASAYAQRADVAASGPSDFALAWFIQGPYAEGTGVPSGPNLLRFRRVSADLQTLGEVLGVPGEVGYGQDVRVLGSARAGVEPLAAWVTIAPGAQNQPPKATLRYALPFAPGLPSSEPLPVSPSMVTVDLGRDADGQALLGLFREGGSPAVRRVSAAFLAEDRLLGLQPGSSSAAMSFVPGAGPERWAVTYVEQSWVFQNPVSLQRFAPRAASVCRF